ncbi:MAG: hypothetical protein NVSMB45_11880 [Ginsengibacter sp.]
MSGAQANFSPVGFRDVAFEGDIVLSVVSIVVDVLVESLLLQEHIATTPNIIMGSILIFIVIEFHYCYQIAVHQEFNVRNTIVIL